MCLIPRPSPLPPCADLSQVHPFPSYKIRTGFVISEDDGISIPLVPSLPAISLPYHIGEKRRFGVVFPPTQWARRGWWKVHKFSSARTRDHAEDTDDALYGRCVVYASSPLRRFSAASTVLYTHTQRARSEKTPLSYPCPRIRMWEAQRKTRFNFSSYFAF